MVGNAPKSMDIDMRPSSGGPPYSFRCIVVTVCAIEAERDGEVDACRGGTWMGLGWYSGVGIATRLPRPDASYAGLGGIICMLGLIVDMGGMPWCMLPGGGDGEAWPHWERDAPCSGGWLA